MVVGRLLAQQFEDGQEVGEVAQRDGDDALDLLRHAVDLLGAEQDVAGLPAEVRLDQVSGLVAQVERLGAQLARRVEAVHRQDDTTVEHGWTTKAWLRHCAGMARADAGAVLSSAHAREAAPLLVDAWERGDVGRRAVLTVVDGLKGVDDPAQRELVQTVVLDYLAGPDGHVDHLPRLLAQARAALQVEDPRERDRRLHARRRLDLATTLDDVGHLTGTLTPEMRSRLAHVLADLSRRQGPDDGRDAGERRHDALDAVLRHYETTGGEHRSPGDDAVRDRVAVVVDAGALSEGLVRLDRDRPGGLDALAQVRGVGLGLLDPEVVGRARADLAAASSPSSTPPGWARLSDGTLVGPDTARRLACDAELLPAVLSGDGEVLDVGRSTRVWPLAVRRAAWLRAGRLCEVGGCDAPHAELHHVRWWSDGGPTALDNSAYLCSYHHWVVHHLPFDLVADRSRFRLRRRRVGGDRPAPAPVPVHPRAVRDVTPTVGDGVDSRRRDGDAEGLGRAA